MSSALKVLVVFMAMTTVAELAAAGKTYMIRWAVSGNYDDWSSTNTVLVGDTVVFTYGVAHTVDELSEADYAACSFAAPVWSDRSGNTTVTFDAAGTRYFACAAAAGWHCSQGQKVAITAVADSTAAAVVVVEGRDSSPPKRKLYGGPSYASRVPGTP